MQNWLEPPKRHQSNIITWLMCLMFAWWQNCTQSYILYIHKLWLYGCGVRLVVFCFLTRKAFHFGIARLGVLRKVHCLLYKQLILFCPLQSIVFLFGKIIIFLSCGCCTLCLCQVAVWKDFILGKVGADWSLSEADWHVHGCESLLNSRAKTTPEICFLL